MGKYFVIVDKTTKEVRSLVNDKESANQFSSANYDKIHWVVDISGPPPATSSKMDKKTLTGDFTFTNGSSNVSVANGDLSNELAVGQFVLFPPDNKVVKVSDIPDANNVTLSENYSGTGGTDKCVLLPHYSTFEDSRGYKEKRRGAYEMEHDSLMACWKGQKELDSVAETTSITGTPTFTNGNPTVTGSGTLFTTELAVGDYIQLDADGVSVKVDSITNNTSLELVENYMGTGGTGAGSKVMEEKGMLDEKRREIKNLYPSS